jgi:hypothetical protein
MSGYKHATVTISQEEYQRLHQADMKRKFKQFNHANSLDGGRDEVISSLIQEIDQREKNLQSVLSDMNRVPSGMDSELFHSIQEQISVNYEQMIQVLRDTNQEFQGSIGELTAAFVREMDYEREANIHNLQSILMHQQELVDRESSKLDTAESWLNQCTFLVDFIQSQFDHDRFTPGRLHKIVRNLEIAENNLLNGYAEACLQQAQQMYLEVSDLNLELEQLLLQWQTLYAETFSELNELIGQLSSNADIRALGLQGEELPDFVNLDYWTNGRYHQLLEHSRQLSVYILQDKNLLTLEDIDRIRSEILPSLRESFETIIFDARLNALNSQLRMNIAEKALEALENHGFVLDDAGYTNNDMRTQFNAQLECPDGSQVLIQVFPTEKSKEELSNELVVITTHPSLKTEHEARLHWEELNNTLTRYNLRVSPPEVIDGSSPSTEDQSGNSHSIEHLYTRIER